MIYKDTIYKVLFLNIKLYIYINNIKFFMIINLFRMNTLLNNCLTKKVCMDFKYYLQHILKDMPFTIKTTYQHIYTGKMP